MVATSLPAPVLETGPQIIKIESKADEYGVVKLHPVQMRFITGIAKAYDDDFPPELFNLVKEKDFQIAINQINNTMKDYWPCFFCIFCGYSCCLCTGGISLLCPNLCIRDAEQYVRALIERINRRECFAKVGIEWSLEKRCGKSWIEISYPLQSKPKHTITYQHSTFNPVNTSSITESSFGSGPRPPVTSASPLLLEL